MLLAVLIALASTACEDDGGGVPFAAGDASFVSDAGIPQSSADGGVDAEAPVVLPPTEGGVRAYLDASDWEAMFPNANALYSYEAFVAAAETYPAFARTGSEEQRRREVAAFLANVSHETTGGWATAPGGAQAWGLYFIEEVGCESGGCTQYCATWNTEYPCASGQTYHGRGPMQLSWNYNYGQAGAALNLPLLENPSLVTSDGTVAFRTALWFWTTEQLPKPSAHDVITGGFVPDAQDLSAGRVPGFGLTINIINGGIECDRPTTAAVEDRVAFFDRFTAQLGVSMGDNLYCDTMTHY